MNRIDFSKFIKQTGFIFLLPLFFILHGNNDYFGLVFYTHLLLLFLKYLLTTAVALGISFLLFRTVAKCALFAIFLLILFFFFGSFHDWAKESFGKQFFTSYSFLLPAIAFVVTLIFILLKRWRGQPDRMLFFFRILFLLLATLELGITGYHFFTSAGRKNDLTTSTDFETDSPTKQSRNVLPDIYFIVLDEYASSKCLQEEFGYDNHQLDSLLIAKKFFISAKSQSNYNITPFSLASTFNLDYLRSGLASERITFKRYLQAMKTFENNRVTAFLTNEGYSVKNYGCFNIESAPTPSIPFFANEVSSIIDGQTLYSRIRRDIWWNVTLYDIFTRDFKIPRGYKAQKRIDIDRNKNNWSSLLAEIKTFSDTPRFLYTHLMLPHPPYYLDSNGREVSDSLVIFNAIPHKQGYMQQLIYTNRLLSELLAAIPSRGDREKVVIIEGDHGFRAFDESVPRSKLFMNLNAYYFSDNDYSQLYDGISPVNTFRVVLNKYFDQRMPLLRDTSIYLVEEEMY